MHQLSKIFLLLFLAISLMGKAQDMGKIKIHSHNDYMQNVPFWSAYANRLNSIEVDIFLKNDTLYATHSEADIKKLRTIESLYLEPLQKAMTLNLEGPKELQLLVDIKSDAHATLKKLVSVLEKYPDIIHSKNISIVISGNMPPPAEFVEYPNYINFDYQKLEDLEDKAIWDKVALISLNFRKFSSWSGQGRLTAKDRATIVKIINQAHSYGKPFRFWGTPDNKTSWKIFNDLGIDFINTDMPYASSVYLKSIQ